MVIRVACILGLIVLASALFHLHDDLAATAWAVRTPLPIDTPRMYRFAARINDNGGVSPFKVGELITGTFTYDLRGKNKVAANLPHGSFESKRNSLAFQLGDLRFSCIGEVSVTIGAFGHAEHFQIIAFDLELPKGWEMDHKKGSQTYSFLLQNAPSNNVITRVAIPERILLRDFRGTRELKLGFCPGIRFPGGQVKEHATVTATVETLE